MARRFFQSFLGEQKAVAPSSAPNHDAVSRKSKSFPLFLNLQDDLQAKILSFVADAPFESKALDNKPPAAISSLTHTLPCVNRQFHMMSTSDAFWKAALLRMVQREPSLWKTALEKLCESEENGNGGGGDDDEAALEALIERAQDHLLATRRSYKALYEIVVNEYLRFKGPVFIMRSQAILGEIYGLHFFEPRYRLLIAEVMQNQPESAKNGGRIPNPVYFLHANRGTLDPATPALLVKVVQCEIYGDGRADVLLLPVQYVWMERSWVRPNSGRLYYAQTLKMGKRAEARLNFQSHERRHETMVINVVDQALRFNNWRIQQRES